MAKNMHNRTCSSLFMPMKTPSVTIQGNITVMRYRNDVMRSVLLHIRANLGMMLARDYARCHAARSTLVMIVANNVYKLRWPAKSLDFNPIDHVYSQPHFINEYMVPCCRCDTRWMYKVLERSQIRHDLSLQFLC